MDTCNFCKKKKKNPSTLKTFKGVICKVQLLGIISLYLDKM